MIEISRRNMMLAVSGYGSSLLALDHVERAPKFTAKTMSGMVVNNESIAGKVVLVQFWATWCQYCRRDAEPVDHIIDEFSSDGLVVLAVDVKESKGTVKSFLQQNPRKAHIVLTGDTNLTTAFEAKAFPLYVLINREGRIAGRQEGAGGERALRQLLAKAGLGEQAR